MKIERETKRSDRSLRRDCTEPRHTRSSKVGGRLETWTSEWTREGRQDRREGEVGKAKAPNSFIHIS